MADLKKIDKSYIAGTYNRFPVVITGGSGSEVYDDKGKRYIDMGSRRLRVYPDALKPTLNAIEKSGMRISEHHETAMAHIIVCTKPSPLQ